MNHSKIPVSQINWDKLRARVYKSTPRSVPKVQSRPKSEKTWVSADNWLSILNEDDDPMRQSSVMRAAIKARISNLDARVILDMLKDGYCNRSNVAWDIATSSSFLPVIRRQAADLYDSFGLAPEGHARETVETQLRWDKKQKT